MTLVSRCLIALLFSLGIFVSAHAGSGLLKVDVGDYPPSYASTKCGGVNEGVEEGKTTCYTCRSGNAPLFYVFLKNQSPSKAEKELIAKLNALVGKRKEEKVTGVVNFLGDPESETERESLKKLASQNQWNHLAITVTEHGDKFDLQEGDDVTVIMFEEGVIRLRASLASQDLDSKTTELLISRSKALID